MKVSFLRLEAMKFNYNLKVVLGLVIPLLLSTSTYGAGLVAARLLDEAATFAKNTVRAGELGNQQFIANMQEVKKLIPGNDTEKALKNFFDEIEDKIDPSDDAAFKAFKASALKEKGITPEGVQQLHDNLVYFSMRYRSPNGAKYLHCFVCGGKGASSSQVAKGFNYSILDAAGTPLERYVKEANKFSARELNAEIVGLMKKSGFEDFKLSESPVFPGQELSLYLILKASRHRGKGVMTPYAKYSKELIKLAKETSKDGKFFGSENPNTLHLILQETLNGTNASNEARAEVVDVWYDVVNKTLNSMKKDGSLTLDAAFVKMMKSRGYNKQGDVIDQKFIDEVDELLSRCRFVGRS